MSNTNEHFDKFVQLCGSRYSATVFVAAQARILAERYDNVISHAEALSWVLSGVVPNDILRYRDKIIQRETRPLQFTQSILSQVLDEDVKKSVYDSLYKSYKSGHLLYVYEGVYDEYRQARIRILTKMLWDKLCDQEYF